MIPDDIGEIKICKKTDDGFPEKFLDYKGMPEEIYYSGDISILNDHRCVAVIGSRSCSDLNLKFAETVGIITAEEGAVLVNGLALGCDTVAIKGALKKGGKCVAILPGGLASIYPRENISLAKEIIENGGCLLSEYAPESRPEKYTFVKRDRLQSALSVGVFVVAAETDSGTMHTVNAAVRQGKRLACYAYELSRMSGNQYMKESQNAEEIFNEDQYREFVRNLASFDYRQMSFL